eukprot:gene2464-3174_t
MEKKDEMELETEGKSVDYTKRMVPNVPIPLVKTYLKIQDLHNEDGEIQFEVLKKHLLNEGRIEKKLAIEIIKKAAVLFAKEPNLLYMQEPVTVCGDIHGQFYDLVKLFDISGDPKNEQYLFLGDYVDRGAFGIECVFLLFCYKIMYPKTFIMLRGNHECRHLTTYFNFKKECLYKYDEDIYNNVMVAFDALPLAVILNDKFLCVHGGLSPDIVTIDDIYDIDRFIETPATGPMCDLLWSDPMNDDEEMLIDEENMFQYNELRGCSFTYSYLAVETFLKNNNLLSVIRAHEAQDNGYKLYKADPVTQFPMIICIFSAPNYCDAYRNKAAIIKFESNMMNVKQFTQVTHPYFLPNFMNVFNWSIPFVGEKVSHIFQFLVDYSEELEEQKENDEDFKLDSDKAESIKTKVLTLGRIANMYSTLRKEKELILQLKGLTGGHIPQGLLFKGTNAMKEAITSFEMAKKFDQESEKYPYQKGEVIQLKRKGSFAQSPKLSNLKKYKERKSSDSPIIINLNQEEQKKMDDLVRKIEVDGMDEVDSD